MQNLVFLLSLQNAQAKNFGIQTIGVPAYDRVFRKAQQMNKTVTTTERNTRKMKVNFNKAMQLSQKSTYEHGVQELQKRAQNALKLTMRGNVPVITAKSTVPTRIKAGVSALNTVCRTHIKSLRQLSTLPQKSKALQVQVQHFPSAYRAEISENPIAILTHILQFRTISRNLRTIGGLPQRITDVVKRINYQLKTIFQSFGKHWQNQ